MSNIQSNVKISIALLKFLEIQEYIPSISTGKTSQLLLTTVRYIYHPTLTNRSFLFTVYGFIWYVYFRGSTRQQSIGQDLELIGNVPLLQQEVFFKQP